MFRANQIMKILFKTILVTLFAASQSFSSTEEVATSKEVKSGSVVRVVTPTKTDRTVKATPVVIDVPPSTTDQAVTPTPLANSLKMNSKSSLQSSQAITHIQTFVSSSVDEFAKGKNKQSIMWYIGSITGGVGAFSLVLSAHYDGLAAVERNKAAAIYESNSNEGYSEAYNNMNELKDKRNALFSTGMILGAIGGGIVLYELFIVDDVKLQPTIDGAQVSVRF